MRRSVDFLFDLADFISRAQWVAASIFGLGILALLSTVIAFLGDLPWWLGLIYGSFIGALCILVAALLLRPVFAYFATPYVVTFISWPESGLNLIRNPYTPLKQGAQPPTLPFNATDGYARLEVGSRLGLVRECSVTVKSISLVDYGFGTVSQQVGGVPLVRLTRPPRMLCWHPEAKDGNHRAYQNLPRGLPRQVALAAVRSNDPTHCELVCADDMGREIIPRGDYRLDLATTSDASPGAMETLAVWLHFDPRGGISPLLQIDSWERGEAIVAADATARLSDQAAQSTP